MSGRGTYDQGPMPQNPYSRGNQPRPSPSQAGAKMGGSPSMMGRGRGGQAPPNSLMAQLAANPNMPAPNQNIDIDNSSRQANVDFMNNMAQENALEGGMSPAYSYDPQTGQYARDSSSFGLTGDAATTYYSPQEFQSQFGRALGKMPSNQAAQMPSDQTDQARAQAAMAQSQSGMRSSGMPYMVGLRNFDPSRSIPNIAPEPKSQTVDASQFDPSQFRMSGGKGGYFPSGPYTPPQTPMPEIPVETMPADPEPNPIESSDPVEGKNPIGFDDPRLPPPPPPPPPFVRPRPTRGLFSDQSGIASLRGQYRGPSMSNPQFQPYRPVQRYQPPQRMPRPPYRPMPMPRPPMGGGNKGGRQRPMPMPRPMPRPMPMPYPQPPRGGPSKGGFPPPQRRPSGPTKGGRPDSRYQPTIPFNPPYGR